MADYLPKTKSRMKRQASRKKKRPQPRVGKSDPRAIHQQKPSMSDIIGETMRKKKKGLL